MQDNLISIDSRRFSPRYIVTSLIINVVVNTLIAVILHAIGFGKGFIGTLIFSQCIGMSIYLANLAALRLFRTVTRGFLQVIVIVGAVITGAIVGTVLGALVNGFNLLQLIREYSTFFGQVVLIALLFGGIVSYIFISITVISDEKVRRLESEKSAMEAELKLIQSQMEPHFLFNTLSNVLGLIDADADRARRMLQSFTTFLRSSITTARERTVTLEQEMSVVKSYLDVYAIRMGERLTYRIDMPEDLRACRIPPLSIQPLVENAVKHGLEPQVQGGDISVRVERTGDNVRISVIDTGKGIAEKTVGRGIGIDNIKKRLELLYGLRGRLWFEENLPSGVRVIVEIPFNISLKSSHQEG
jgi:sensor histidine kinase YesM